MTQMEITALTRAGYAPIAWSAHGRDGRIHVAALLAATASALGILAVAALFLMGVH